MVGPEMSTTSELKSGPQEIAGHGRGPGNRNPAITTETARTTGDATRKISRRRSVGPLGRGAGARRASRAAMVSESAHGDSIAERAARRFGRNKRTGFLTALPSIRAKGLQNQPVV